MNTKLYILKTTGKGTEMEAGIIKASVKLSGIDGNALVILGACQRAWRKAGNSQEEWEAISSEMTSGNYNNLLVVAFKHFDVY